MRSGLLASALLGASIGFATGCAESNAPVDAAAPIDAAEPPDLGGLGDVDLPISSSDLRTSCDLGGEDNDERLFVTATTANKAPYAAERRGDTWAMVPIGGADFIAVVSTDVAGRPLAIARRTDDSLAGATYEPCSQQLPAPSALFAPGVSADRPALAGGARVDLIFPSALAGAPRLYYSRFEGSWQTPMALNNLLSARSPAALRVGSEVHALFTATDGQLYDGLVDNNGGVATPIPGASSDRSPAAVATADGTIHVVWKGSGTDLVYSARAPGGAYSEAKLLCGDQVGCSMQSNEAPQLVVDRNGVPSVAWIGKSNGLVYSAHLDGSALWSTATAVSSEPTTLPPAIAPGASGAELEVVYVRAADGKARHVRAMSGVYTTPSDLPGGPLSSAPSLLRLGTP